MTQPTDEWAWLSSQPGNTERPEANTADHELAKSFARTFSQENGREDGKRVLAHLRSLTRERTLGPETPDTVLRHVEGQRGLVAYIERLITRGRA